MEEEGEDYEEEGDEEEGEGLDENDVMFVVESFPANLFSRSHSDMMQSLLPPHVTIP